MNRTSRPAMGTFIFFGVAFALSVYFTFAAVQGDFGLLRRAVIEAEAKAMQSELDEARQEVSRMENLTLRLSDDYLDLDLLDEQARGILGLLRSDEIVIR